MSKTYIRQAYALSLWERIVEWIREESMKFILFIPFAIMLAGVIVVMRIMILWNMFKGKETWKMADMLIPEDDYNRKFKGTLGVKE
ncbi:MAG: hypothetical protein P9M12_06785 [Candidatus Aceula lacicola]|nr:hypothetical protein [Candidatus Aceula lacicola]